MILACNEDTSMADTAIKIAIVWFVNLPPHLSSGIRIQNHRGTKKIDQKARELISSRYMVLKELIEGGCDQDRAVSFIVDTLQYPDRFHSIHVYGELWEYENGKITSVLVPEYQSFEHQSSEYQEFGYQPFESQECQ